MSEQPAVYLVRTVRAGRVLDDGRQVVLQVDGLRSFAYDGSPLQVVGHAVIWAEAQATRPAIAVRQGRVQGPFPAKPAPSDDARQCDGAQSRATPHPTGSNHMSNASTAKTTLADFAPGDPCGPIAHALAIGDMWTPEQWSAAVGLVNELRPQGLLAPLPAQASAPLADDEATAPHAQLSGPPTPLSIVLSSTRSPTR